MVKITDIAKNEGVRYSTIYRYLSGERDITLKTALSICRKYKLPLKVFTDGEIQEKHFGKSFLNDKKDCK